VDAGKAHAEKDGVEIGGEFAEREIATEHLAGADFDAADSGHVFHFAAREVVGRLVGGDAVFIEAAGLFTRVEDNDRVPVDSQPMGGGKAGRTCANDGDAAAGGGRAAIEL